MNDPGLILAPVVACFSLGAWLIAHRRHRVTADTPTSNIASAVQGYVELHGHANVHPSAPLLSRIHGLPCVWYRYIVQERRSDKWQTVQQDTSDCTFLLRDETGECIVDPDHADILTDHSEVKTVRDQRLMEFLLLPKDRLYALGQFKTLNPVDTRLDPHDDVGAVLAEWKKNRPGLLDRFDLNRDDEIDEREWQLARAQAKRDVAKQHRAIRAQPGFHILHAPSDGRRFLITNRDPDRMATALQRWSWFFMGLFVASLGYFGHLVSHQ